MVDMELMVAESLRADADRPIKVDGLHDGAVARAGSIRRRHRVLGATAAAGLVVAVGGAGVAPRFAALPGPPANVNRHAADAGADTPPPAPVSAAGPTNLPELVGVPTAGQKPAVVGSDPTVLHFDVNLAALKATASAWTAGRGYEKATINTSTRNPNPRIEIVLTSDPKMLDGVMVRPGWMQERADGTYEGTNPGPTTPTTVNGRPGTLAKITVDLLPKETYDNSFSWILRWQPVDGLYAQVQAIELDKSRAFAAAAALRLDHAQRCVMPLRLTGLPAGVSVRQCDIAVRRSPQAGRSGVFISSGFELAFPDGHQVNLWFEDDKIPDHPHDRGWFQPNRTVAGYPAMWMIKGEKGLAIDYGAISAGVWPGRRNNRQDVDRLTEAEASALAAGVKLAGDVSRPETWPQRPIG